MAHNTSHPVQSSPVFVGIDLGSSGCRAMAIDHQAQICAQAVVALPLPQRKGLCIEQDPKLWWDAVQSVLAKLVASLSSPAIAAMAVDGTSGTILLTDGNGVALTPALMYNDTRALSQAKQIAKHMPPNSAAQGPHSGLAKLLWLTEHTKSTAIHHLLHQTDWITGKLSGRFGISDTNNALKTGFDPVQNQWPSWLDILHVKHHWLPQVHSPGTPVGTMDKNLAASLGLPGDIKIMAGTTDSTAAFMATGANTPGEAVSSLGSTLVLKIIAQQPVFAAQYGIYSQPLGDHWLVGGGSNSGGAVLSHYFSEQQIQQMTTQLIPTHTTGLDYYPLLYKGERFPVNDPDFPPRLSPRPKDPLRFFQGMLEGMAQIECNGYQRMTELGVPYPVSVTSVGGGASNNAWTLMRGHLLQTKMLPAKHTEAAYGTALLALQGCLK